MSRHIAALVSAVILVSALLMSGCPKPETTTVPTAPTGQGPSVEAPAPPAAEKVPVRFTWSDKACYAPVIVAFEEGYYAEEGLEVDPKPVTGGIESAELLISGQADLGTMGDAPACIALSRSDKLRLICDQADGIRMHRIVVHNASGIKEPKDFEGKRVAVQQGSSTHGGFLAYCKANGIDTAKLTFVPLSPKDFPEAMVTKQVDLVAGSEPWPGNVMAACKDCAEFANLEGLGSIYPLPVLARQQLLAEHPDLAARVVRATRKGAELCKSDPDKAAQIITARPRDRHDRIMYGSEP